MNTDGTPIIGLGFEGPLSGSNHRGLNIDSPFQKHLESTLHNPALESGTRTYTAFGSSLRRDQVHLPTHFIVAIRGIDIGKRHPRWQERSPQETRAGTPLPPSPAASTPTINPPVAGPDPMSIIPSTATTSSKYQRRYSTGAIAISHNVFASTDHEEAKP